jgi:MFS family permease
MSDTNPVDVARRRHDLSEAATRKVFRRLIPFLLLMYVIAFLDRSNVSFAQKEFQADFGISSAAYAFGAGLFFVGYAVFEIPSNILLHKVGARWWLARIMVSWGIVAALFTWVQNDTQLYALRFLLGVAEAGFFPGAILFLSLWVPTQHRSKILALFYLAQPLTTVLGAPLAGALLSANGSLGLAGWRFMYLAVAVPAVIIGVAAWFYLPDRPRDAKWLTPGEADWLTDALSREAKTKTGGEHHGMRAAFGNGRVWVLCLVYFGFVYGLYALAFFLPTIISGFETQFGTKFGFIEKGLITAIPYLPAAIFLYFWSKDAERRGVRTWHVAGPAVVGGLSIPLALYMGSPAATVAVITVTACAIFGALPNFWTIPSRFLTGAAAAAGIALINTFGNIAGFAAGYVTGWLKDATGSYTVPMFVVGGLMLVSAVLLIALARRGRIESDADAPAVPAHH